MALFSPALRQKNGRVGGASVLGTDCSQPAQQVVTRSKFRAKRVQSEPPVEFSASINNYGRVSGIWVTGAPGRIR